MAKNQNVKIKRYKRNMGSAPSAAAQMVKKAALLIAGALIVVALGYFLGKPVMNFITSLGTVTDNDSSISENIPRSSQDSQSDTSLPASGDGAEPSGGETQVSVKQRVYYFATPQNLANEGAVDSLISNMKSKGATHCVFDVKNSEGYLLYNSRNTYGSQLKADTVIDLQMVTKKMAENDITPVARMYTFMDKMISTVERSTAVMYRGTDTRWLDSSAALGGKAWANPASSIMQQYIVDLTDEVMSMGVKEIIYAGFQTPTGYSLDKRDFGAGTDQVLANMKNLIVTLKGKVSAAGGYSAWQFDYSAVDPEGSYRQYIVHPYQLGADNVILTAPSDGITEEKIRRLKNSHEGVNSVTLWITEGAEFESAKQLGIILSADYKN